MAVCSNPIVTKCIEKREKAHLALRMKIRMVGRWLENGALIEWKEDQIDSELRNLEAAFDKLCDAHAELASAVKHNNAQGFSGSMTKPWKISL